jgi:hypothetical protein
LSASSTLSYSWFPSTGLSSTTSYSVKANPPTTTNYTVLLSMGSCTNSTQLTIQVVPCIVGIHSNNPSESPSLNFYPNPNDGNFSILSQKDEIAIIINELGQTLKTLYLFKETEIKISGLSPGIYFIVTPNSRKKILVTH